MIRLGIVGLGEHSCRAHIKHLIKDNRIQVVAAFDPGVTLESFQQKLQHMPNNIKLFSDEDAFWNYQMDAVVIASPDAFHGVQMQKAINKGLHIFCEKPMAVTHPDLKILQQTLQVAAEKNLVVATCHPRRFDPPFLWLKSQIDSGALERDIGKILHFDFTFWYRQVEDTPEYAWKKQRSLLSDHFGHEIDALAFLFPQHGAATLNALKTYDSYRHYEVVGNSTTGLSYRFLGLRTRTEVAYDESVRIDGERGSWLISLSKGKCIKMPEAVIEDIPMIDYDVRFAAVNTNFIDAILHTAPNYLNHNDLLRNNSMSVQLDKEGVTQYPVANIKLGI